MSQAGERDKTRLTDDEWERIFTKLRATSGIYTGGSYQCRHIVEAVLWVLRVGGQWRLLPRDRGNWNSVYKRHARWSQRGVGASFLSGRQKAWPVSGRLWLQDSRRRRCAGVAAEIYPDRGASGGYYPGDPADGRPACPGLFGRQGL